MNIAAIEAALIARLKASVPEARAVYSADGLAGIEERSQTTPALHVILAKLAVIDGAIDGSAAQIAQTWYVVAVTRNAAQAAGKGPALARQNSGALVDAVAAALMGWRLPLPGCGPLRLTNPPAPVFNGGYGYFPLAFNVEVVTKGLP